MKGWILYKDSSKELSLERHEIDRFKEEAERQKIDLTVIAPEELELVVSRKSRDDSVFFHAHSVERPDFFLPRMGVKTEYFGLAITRELERKGVLAINSSRTIEVVKDKLYTHQLLAQKHIPVPKTMLVKFPVDAEHVGQLLGFPLIVKAIFGTHGNGVYLSETKSKFLDLMNFIEGTDSNAQIILQEFIADSFGRDLRVFTIGGRVVACIERRAVGNDFKANVSQGAEPRPYKVTDEIEWLATETARILNLDVGGIDLLFDKGHFKVCEANSSPGFRGIESCCDVNIPAAIFDYIRFRLGLLLD